MKKGLVGEQSSKKSTLVGLCVWLVLVILFFAPATIGGKVIAPNDCIECIFRPFAHRPIEEVHNQFIVDGASQYVPHKWALKEQWEQDGYMGWNPYVYNGTASPENTMYSPGDWHNYLFAFMPFWDAWNLGIVLQFFIAGCGMILLLRYFKIPVWVALLAAVSFAFYSQFIICLYYRWLGGIVWAPYLVWALIRYKQHMVNVPAIIFMSLAWRGGHMQSCLFLFTLVTCMWVSDVWKKEGKWPTLSQFFKKTCSYFLTGAVGALLALDVFVDTFPRMEGCKSLVFCWGTSNFITYLSALFPTIFGVPQSMDAMKIVGCSLFDVKFGGAIVFILALMACFNPRAPRPAKFIFIIIGIAVCTPLYTYLYSRGTVVMALGMAWLAAWQLYDFTQNQYSLVFWKRVGYAVVATAALWVIASIFIVCFKEPIADILNQQVINATTSCAQLFRRDWYLMRVERLLSYILIWNWQNVALMICLSLGVFFCSRVRPGNARNGLWMVGVVVITFAELCVFSYSWLSYGKRIDGPYPYEAPAWLPELKKHVHDGSVTIAQPVPDGDFLFTNHFLVYGVRIAYGYETVQPKFLRPLSPWSYDTKDCALAGISHVMSNTTWKDSELPSGWNLVMQEKGFKLYENSEYIGRYIVDGVGIKENWRTSSRIHLTIPAGSKSLSVLESYHSGWKAYADNAEVDIEKDERGGMEIKLPSSDKPYDVLLEFHMPYREFTYSVMAVTALLLMMVYWRQRKAKIQ